MGQGAVGSRAEGGRQRGRVAGHHWRAGGGGPRRVRRCRPPRDPPAAQAAERAAAKPADFCRWLDSLEIAHRNVIVEILTPAVRLAAAAQVCPDLRGQVLEADRPGD